MNTVSSPEKVVSQLMQLYLEKETGSLCIIVNKKFAIINFENGNINHIFFKGSKGNDAIDLLKYDLIENSDKIITQFTEGVVANMKLSLPATIDIISQLAENKAAINIIDNTGIGFEFEQTLSNSDRGTLITDDIKDVVEATLIELIGPMGSLLWEEAANSTQSLREAIDIIVAELPDQKTEEALLERIRTGSGFNS